MVSASDITDESQEKNYVAIYSNTDFAWMIFANNFVLPVIKHD